MKTRKRGDGEKRGDGGKREKGTARKGGTEEKEKKGRRKILTFEKKGRTLLVTLFMFG